MIRGRPKHVTTQIFFALGLGAALALSAHNIITNLARQGIASGFDFLGETAGFAIIQTLIPYTEASSYGRAFFVGLLNTCLVAIFGIILATVGGFLLGIGRLSSNWLVARLASIYIETIRNVPLLLQIFFWYFVVLRSLPVPRLSYRYLDMIFLNNRGIYLPAITVNPAGQYAIIAAAVVLAMAAAAKIHVARSPGRGPASQWLALSIIVGIPFTTLVCGWLMVGSPIAVSRPVLTGFNFQGGTVVIPEFAALLLGLSTYTAAFIAEIVRAGIQGVPPGQREAALSLGMSYGQTLRLVIIPQAMRIIVPPLTSQYLNIVKNSSLAAAIGYPDLVAVFAGTVLNQTGQAVEVIFITMMVYLTASLTISWIMGRYQARTRWAAT